MQSLNADFHAWQDRAVLDSTSATHGKHRRDDGGKKRCRGGFGYSNDREAIDSDIIGAITGDIKLQRLDVGEVETSEIIEKELVVPRTRSRFGDRTATV